jgi:chromosome partitioning protein
VNVLDPIFPELASIRQGHAEGRAASEVPFPKVQEKAIAVAQAIMNRLPGMKEAA